MTAVRWEQARTWDEAQPVGSAATPHLRSLAAPPSRRRPGPAVIRRRRLVVATLLVVLCIVGPRAGGAWLGASAEAGAASPSAPVVLVAEAGDTYWALAARVSAGGDIRSTVDNLVRANGGRELRIGDRILLYR